MRELSVQLGDATLASPPSAARARAASLVARYTPPAFVTGAVLAHAPAGRISLAMTPTPLLPLDLGASLQRALLGYLPSAQSEDEAQRLAASVRWSIKVRMWRARREGGGSSLSPATRRGESRKPHHCPSPATAVTRSSPSATCEHAATAPQHDDMSGSMLGGNKVRKLEFELAVALQQGATDVIACGGVQSNYARAACAAAMQCGLRPHAVLRADDPSQGDEAFGWHGNALLHRMMGTNVRLTGRVPFKTGLLPVMEELAASIAAGGGGRKAHILPVGGSGADGVWGYLEAWAELEAQLRDVSSSDRPSDVFVATGSGGTAAGLAIANALTGSRMRIHAVCVCDDAAYFLGHCDEMIEALGLESSMDAASILSVVEGFKGSGYGRTTAEDLRAMHGIALESGVLLDATYTGKGMLGALGCTAAALAGRDAASFGEAFHGLQGRHCLFWHTGGLFGAMDGMLSELMRSGEVPTAAAVEAAAPTSP